MYWFYGRNLIEITSNEYFSQVSHLLTLGIENVPDMFYDMTVGDTYFSVVRTNGCDYLMFASRLSIDDSDSFFCKMETITEEDRERIRKILDAPVSIF